MNQSKDPSCLSHQFDLSLRFNRHCHKLLSQNLHNGVKYFIQLFCSVYYLENALLSVVVKQRLCLSMIYLETGSHGLLIVIIAEMKLRR